MKVDKSIVSTRIVGSDNFVLIYSRKSDKYLKDYLPLFNIDDYNIIKATGAQRIVSIEDVKEFRHAGYIFYKKDKYDKKHIENWLELLKSIGGIKYLSKPLPPFSPNKIIIK